MNKVIFISFDFGLKSDYENLYKWLDENEAVERGYGMAYIKNFRVGKKLTTDKAFVFHMRKVIKEKVKIGNNDRIYMIWNGIEDDTKMRSGFIFGSAKQSPWTGYAQKSADDFELDFE